MTLFTTVFDDFFGNPRPDPSRVFPSFPYGSFRGHRDNTQHFGSKGDRFASSAFHRMAGMKSQQQREKNQRTLSAQQRARAANKRRMIGHPFLRQLHAPTRRNHYRQPSDAANRQALVDQKRTVYAKRLRQYYAARTIQRSYRDYQEELKRQRSVLRRAAHLRHSLAAKKIQRTLRAAQAMRRFDAQNNAALIITRAVRALPLIVEAKRIRSVLMELRGLQVSVKTSTEEHARRLIASSKNFRQQQLSHLQHEDELMKIQLSVDNCHANGSNIIRAARKGVICRAQELLDRSDHMLAMARLRSDQAVKVISMDADLAAMELDVSGASGSSEDDG